MSMTENEAKKYMLIEKECINRDCNRDCANCDIVQNVEDLNNAYDVAINALEKQIARKPDEYVPELLDDEIKLPYKISRLEAKAIKVALFHQWFKITDANGNAISCSQEMADANYKMLSLFDKLIKECDKDNEIKEQENGYR